VSGTQDVPGVAVRVAVVADAAIPIEGVGGGTRWSLTGEEETGAGEESAVEKVAAGNRRVQAKPIPIVRGADARNIYPGMDRGRTPLALVTNRRGCNVLYG
jgi:hypothetical protein